MPAKPKTNKKKSRVPKVTVSPVITVGNGPYVAGYGPMVADVHKTRLQLRNMGCYNSIDMDKAKVRSIVKFFETCLEAMDYKYELVKSDKKKKKKD